MTLSAARTSAMTVMSSLKNMRSEECFHALWLQICQSAGELGLSSPVMPRKRRPPRRLDDGDAPCEYADCSVMHRIETWFAFLDIVVSEIGERFAQDCFKAVATLKTCCCGLLVECQ